MYHKIRSSPVFWHLLLAMGLVVGIFGCALVGTANQADVNLVQGQRLIFDLVGLILALTGVVVAKTASWRVLKP